MNEKNDSIKEQFGANMSYEFLRELLHRHPFEPFALHLSNGEVHTVGHPECAILTKTRVVITDPDPEADYIMVCSLLHVARVEMLQPAAS